MVRSINDILGKFRDENIAGKYIYINVAIYLIMALTGVFATLFNVVQPLVEFVKWFQLPADVMQLLYQPWSLVTYMFVHGGFMHILWNMFALYVFGRIFLEFYSVKHFTGVYMLGGIVGGLFFVIAYNLFPYFKGQVENAHLVGASAAVLAIVTAAAVRTPNYTVNMLLIGRIRLMTLAIITVVISFLMLASDNAGGNFAHLGGAAAGWLFATMLNKGHDMTSLIALVADTFSGFVSRIKSKKRRPKMEFTRGTGKHSADYDYNANKRRDEDAMNQILDKIKKSGYSSLTEDEKKRLFDASGK